MKHLLLLCIFGSASFSAFGQSTLSTDGRWEIGVDFLPLVDTSYTIKNSILVRRVIGDRSKLRCRIGISFEEIRNRPSITLSDQDLLSGRPFQGYFSLGHERYLHVGRISVFTGSDVFGMYSRQSEQAELDTRPNVTPPTIYKIKDLYQEYKTGLNLLVGVNIRIIPHLYFSTEAVLQTAYRWQEEKYRKYEGEELKLTAASRSTIKTWIFKLQPVSAIHLIYQFNKKQL